MLEGGTVVCSFPKFIRRTSTMQRTLNTESSSKRSMTISKSCLGRRTAGREVRKFQDQQE